MRSNGHINLPQADSNTITVLNKVFITKSITN